MPTELLSVSTTVLALIALARAYAFLTQEFQRL